MSRYNRMLSSFLVTTLFYIVALFYLEDETSAEKYRLLDVANYLYIITLLLFSLLCRYTRWHFIMLEKGVKHRYFLGLFIYMSGFAYTATPGKVGELSRAIFYKYINLDVSKVISAFIIERIFDLIVVLGFSSVLIIGQDDLLYVGIGTVTMLFIVGVSVLFPNIIKLLIKLNDQYGLRVFSKLLKFSLQVIFSIRGVVNGKIILYGFLFGIPAWIATSYIFISILEVFDIKLSILDSLSIYPTAMLAGALSFIPGGLGATEATMVYLLGNFDVKFSDGIAVALLARFSTLWLAVIIGIIANLVLNVIFKNQE